MAQLTLQQRQDRLRLDYRVATEMRSPVMSVTAYRNADDLEARRNPVESEEEGHLAAHYLVVYNLKTLVGRDSYSDRTTVKFDLLANGNYPFTPPACFVASGQMPWTPHFREGLPICTDNEMWLATKGRMLLGHWLVHVAKLLNFDEIPRTNDYGGYTPQAAEYWRTELNRQPITPGFSYPVLPEWISTRSAVVFKAAESFFEPKPSGDAPGTCAGMTSDFESASEVFTPKPRQGPTIE